MITTTFPDNADQTKPFPKIRRSTKSGMVVLFEASKKGMVLSQGQGAWPVGSFKTNWVEDHFEDYNGPVTLQNK